MSQIVNGARCRNKCELNKQQHVYNIKVIINCLLSGRTAKKVLIEFSVQYDSMYVGDNISNGISEYIM